MGTKISDMISRYSEGCTHLWGTVHLNFPRRRRMLGLGGLEALGLIHGWEDGRRGAGGRVYILGQDPVKVVTAHHSPT